MRSCRQFLSPSASLRVAAVLVLSGTVAAACSSAPADSTGLAQQALTGGSPCAGVQLDAARQYKPKSWTDGQVSFAVGSLTFQVPSVIPVTAGASAHGKAKFTYSLGGGIPVTCLYRGNDGDAYTFVKCRQADVPRPDVDDDDNDHEDGTADPQSPTAGSTVAGDSFTLHVNKGSKSAGTTSVSLHLGGPVISDGNACTTDSCSSADGVTHTPINIDDHDDCTVDACDPLTGTTHTLFDSTFCRGQANFNDGTLAGLGGNGRACSTCHVASDAFQLTPSTAEARFQSLQAARVTNPSADDPLFRAIDADDFRTNGNAASNFSNLRQRGLVRITMPLPPNMRLLDCGSTIPCPASALPTSETVADVWRSTPSVFNVNVTGPDGQIPFWPRAPNTTGGYQLDGRVDTLQNQALGALHGHAGVTSDPLASWLDDVAGFEQALVTPREPAVLTQQEQDGKAVFTRSCATCHGGVGTTTPLTVSAGFAQITRYSDISTAFPRSVDAVTPTNPTPRWVFNRASQLAGNARTYEITFADGFKLRRTTTDPGRALLTGFVFSAPAPVAPAVCAHPPCGSPVQDDWQKFDNAPLFGIAGTAPYFHNNSAATLVDVLDHYEQFFARAKTIAPASAILSTVFATPPLWDRPFKTAAQDGGVERAALLAYLNKL